MMRILQIHTKMVAGGIEAIVCGLVNELSKSEDVTLCTIFEPQNDDVFYRKVSNRVNKTTIGKRNYGFSIKEIFKVAKLIRRGGYDVVHVHGCFQYYFFAMLLFHKKIKFFYTIHSDARKENQTWDWRLFKLKQFLFSHRWVVPITVSKVSQESFRSLYRCECELIENGTTMPVVNKDYFNINKYRISSKTKVFVHAGRISEAKNQVVLCKVFKRLISEGKDVVLLIAGAIEDEYIYQNLKGYFSERIIYIGEHNDIPSIFAQADSFCLPSIWEGLPVTLLEALSVGCVPICSPVGGIVDVVTDEINGILSSSSSEEDYYNAVLRFLTYDGDIICGMKMKCKESFARYNISNTAALYLNLYEKTIKNQSFNKQENYIKS